MEYMALGCMSGTSLDGIDCSLIKSDGLSFANEISNEFIPYSKELQKKLLNIISQEYLNDPSINLTKRGIQESYQSIYKK